MSFLDDVKEYFRRGYRAGRSCRNGLEASAGCDEREAELAKCRSVITELADRVPRKCGNGVRMGQQNSQPAELADPGRSLTRALEEPHRAVVIAIRQRARARPDQKWKPQGHNREPNPSSTILALCTAQGAASRHAPVGNRE